MRRTKSMWSNPRPVLTIERGAGAQLGNCYYGSSFTLTSTRPLDMEDIKKIRDTGLIGHGQEFYIRGQLIDNKLVPVPPSLDWKTSGDVAPSGREMIEARVYDDATGALLPDVLAVNEYTKEPLKPMEMSYYVYVTEDRVDSSD